MEQPRKRRIEIEVDLDHKAARPATVQVVCADKPGILALFSQTFHDQGLNISQANCRTLDDDRAVNTFKVSVVDVDQLQKSFGRYKAAGVFCGSAECNRQSESLRSRCK